MPSPGRARSDPGESGCRRRLLVAVEPQSCKHLRDRVPGVAEHPSSCQSTTGSCGRPRLEAELRGAQLGVRLIGCADRRISRVSVVKINAITVPRERFDEFAQRFASRAGRVSDASGFEGFELLRPNDDREVCLVLTRWRSEADFQAWVASPAFAAGHSQHRDRGPVGIASELWSFDVLEREEPPGGCS